MTTETNQRIPYVANRRIPRIAAAESGCERYGSRFYTVALADSSEVDFYAERVEVTANGDLVAYLAFSPDHDDAIHSGREPMREPERLGMAIAAGAWLWVVPSSVWNGDAINVQRHIGAEDAEAKP